MKDALTRAGVRRQRELVALVLRALGPVRKPEPHGDG